MEGETSEGETIEGEIIEGETSEGYMTDIPLNLGIGGDRMQHVLWRSMNIDLNPNAKYVIIHCGTNNVDKDQPRAIGKSIMAIRV